MPKEYKLRLQVIATADDDGTNAANITAAVITSYLPTLNQIFEPATVTFLFEDDPDFLKINSTTLNREFTVLEPPNVGDDKWDHKPLVDSTTHNRALSEIAKQFPGKLVVIFRNRKKLKEEEGTGHWYVADKGGGSSGANALFVNMSTICQAVDLAHEIGHYLQLWHPFVSGIKTVADAAAAIKHYVEEDGHPKDSGLNTLDGDRPWVLDTPADASTDIFKSEGVSVCGDVGEIPIPVTFADQSTRTYTLAPDRSLVMSYFKGCPGQKVISPQQARRVRDGLEKRVRNDLISVRPSFDHVLVRAGTATAGAVSEAAIVMVRDGRVATAVRDAGGNLRLIVWDLEDNGATITRRGQAIAGPISQVALCSVGLNLLATAVCDGSSRLKVITWYVEENGSITRLESAERDGEIKDVAVESVAMYYNSMTTASRLADDTLRVDLWLVTANGAVKHTQSATAGKINSLGPVCGVGASSFVTYLRDEAGRLKPILWGYDEDDKLIRLGDTRSAGPALAITGCTLARALAVAAHRGKDMSLKLVAYRFPEDGRYIKEAGATHVQAGMGELQICRLGTEMVVTVDRQGPPAHGSAMRLILWQVTASGSDFVLLDEVTAAETFSKIAVCPASTNQVVAALRGHDGNLQLITWRLQGQYVGGPYLDKFKQLFKTDPQASKRWTGFEDEPDEE